MDALQAIGIAGSPRPRGNSATLMQAVLDGAAAEGAITKSVLLNPLSFRGCQGCEVCTEDLSCILTDDLTPVMADVQACDIWVLAAPIYYDGVSGQLKLFFDRLRHTTRRGASLEPMLPGRRAAAIIVTYADGPRADYRREAEKLAGYLPWMGDFAAVEILAAANLGPPSAAAGRADLLEEARRIGTGLAVALKDADK